MSDFIFSRTKQAAGFLSESINLIYDEYGPKTYEFHGEWGSIAASEGHYFGFDHIETDQYICIILGGPLLQFADNDFIGLSDRSAGTQLILDRWISKGISWDTDVSGPFAALKIDKRSGSVEFATDLMSFIPIFFAENRELIGTHVDALARSAKLYGERDPVSMADFIVNGTVTYPFTIFAGIKQLSPGTSFLWKRGSALQAETYWQPSESNPFKTPAEAAERLAEELQSYIRGITKGLDKVALFLSGGEDSRTVLGMLPPRLERDAFIFLEELNHEGKVAKEAAKAFDANFHCVPRDRLRYLNVLTACSKLVGAGFQYSHVHSYGLHRAAKLNDYRAIFGGFLSDAFFKGYHIRKLNLERLLIFYSFSRNKKKVNYHQKASHFSPTIQDGLKARLEARNLELLEYRTIKSANEWTNIYPVSMHASAPHFFGQRRLFASFEPFASHGAVKIAASIPQFWKLNRIVFQKTARPFLARAKNLPHADGWLPYYSWRINLFYRPVVKIKRRLVRVFHKTSGNVGPWNDWGELLATDEWKDFAINSLKRANIPEGLFKDSIHSLSPDQITSLLSDVNVVQLLNQSSYGNEAGQ